MRRHFADRIFSLFAVFLMLGANFSFAAAQPQPAGAQANAPGSIGSAGNASTPNLAPTTQAQFACSSESISPQELQKLMDATTNNGFEGKELSSGTGAKKDRGELDQNTLVLPTGEGSNAVRRNVPSQEISPDETAHLLNSFVAGPFAFGLVLSDTLRVGRCKDQDSNENCALQGKNLAYRNSGAGIKEDFRNVWDDFKTIFVEKPAEISNDEYDALRANFAQSTGISPEQLNQLQDAQDANKAVSNEDKSLLAGVSDGVKSLKYRFFKREPLDVIPNSILSDSFTASTQTNCDNAACIISSYSFFDKMYNSWFSSQLVVSNFGPSLFGVARNMMNWTMTRNWPWNIEDSKLLQKIRTKFLDLEFLPTQLKAGAMQQRAYAHGLDDLWVPMMENKGGWDGGYYLLKGQSFRSWAKQIFDPKDGAYYKLSPTQKSEFGKIVRDLKSYAKRKEAIWNAAEEEYTTIAKAAGVGTQAEIQARIEFGKTSARLMQNDDEFLNLDVPEWWTRDSMAGLYDVAVKENFSGHYQMLNKDSKNIDMIQKAFMDKGDWSSFAGSGLNTYEVSKLADGRSALQFYRVGPKGQATEAHVEDLEKNLPLFHDKMVVNDKGENLILTETTLPYIKETSTGTVKVYDAGWEKAEAISPEDFAGKLLHPRVKSRTISLFNKNADQLYQSLMEQGFVDRRYFSLLDKYITNEKNVLQEYFSVKGGAKWTLYPFGYWQAKRGFGFEGLSAYQLPDSWSSIIVYHGDEKIFDDAYIDFFSNEGSDQGDIFVQVLNKLPIKIILNEVSDKYNPVKKLYDAVTGNTLRGKVEDIAIYSSTPPECPGCGVSLNSEKLETFSPAFTVTKKFDAYILENPQSNAAKEKGTTLVSYAHHANLKGKSSEIEGGAIDLVKAMQEKKTCSDAIKEGALGWTAGWVGGIGKEKSASRVGAVLALEESAAYAIFSFWGAGEAGIIASLVQQTVLAPKLADCVDSEEGYYIHFTVPKKEEQKETASSEQLSTDKVSEMIDSGTKQVLGSLSNNPDSLLGKQAEELKGKIEDLVGNAAKNDFVEAIVGMDGSSSGKLSGKKLFYFWFKGILSPAKYKTDGRRVIVDPKTGTTLDIDFANGRISVNGQPTVTNPDIVRLATTNSEVPAEEIPHTITKVSLPDSNAVMFEMGLNSDTVVLDQAVLNCIKAGVLEQTGVGLSSNNLSEVFGKTLAIATDSHPNIHADASAKQIIAEGTPRQIVSGQNAKAGILGNRETILRGDSEKRVGLLESIQFENGVIIVKPETKQLIVWLRHNEKAVLDQKDVSGLKAKLESVKNPLTSCSEPAISLEALPTQGSDLAAFKTQQFNQSIQKLGPFQVFDTDKKRFILYSKLEGGKCVDYFKVIDKATGEVYESPISSITQTPDGVQIQTADGQTHSLGFSAENGIPKVTFDGGAPETLLSATGKNGSFYYNPDKGLWYPENGQFIPLSDAFRQQGVTTQANPDGTVSSQPGGNVMNLNIGDKGSGTPFNLPSLPESAAMQFAFIALLLLSFLFVQARFSRRTGP